MAATGLKAPQLASGFLGPQSKFKTFGLSVISHADANIRMKDWDGNVLKIQLSYSDPVKTAVELINASTKEERSECVFTQTDDEDKTITFNITVPTPGHWTFGIFALPASDSGKGLACVYNYLIECVKATQKPYKFPKQYQGWKDGCSLYEPLVIHRDETGPIVPFKVKIPGARNVAVVVNKEWTRLKISSDGSLWTGNVFLGLHYGTNASVTLNANFDGSEGGSYATLLEYERI